DLQGLFPTARVLCPRAKEPATRRQTFRRAPNRSPAGLREAGCPVPYHNLLVATSERVRDGALQTAVRLRHHYRLQLCQPRRSIACSELVPACPLAPEAPRFGHPRPWYNQEPGSPARYSAASLKVEELCLATGSY